MRALKRRLKGLHPSVSISDELRIFPFQFFFVCSYFLNYLCLIKLSLALYLEVSYSSTFVSVKFNGRG